MTDQVATTEQIAPGTFFNFGDKRWWDFKDENTGKDCRIECVQPSSNRFKLIMNLPNDHAEHTFETTPVDFGEQFTLIQSVSKAMTCTWVGGLTIPCPFQVGAKVQAKSMEGNPATGHPVNIIAILEKSTMMHPPAVLHMSPPNLALPAITLTEYLSDLGLGTNLLKLEMVFLDSVGVISAVGNAFGVIYKLTLKTWSGAPNS